MAYTKEEQNYVPKWIEQINKEPFKPKLIPWLTEPQLDQTISVDT